MKDDIAIMVVDDSPMMRKVVTSIVEEEPRFYVVATASNGIYALKKLEVIRPDVLLLDIEMPQMNGIELLQEMKARNIEVPVIILSGVAQKGAAVTVRAMELGAKDFILKPQEGDPKGLEKMGMEVRSKICVWAGSKGAAFITDCREEVLADNIDLAKQALGQLKVNVGRSKESMELFRKKRQLPEVGKRTVCRMPPKLVAIGISTGGPAALREILPEFKKGFPLPIVVVQHMPEGFTKEFALGLNKVCDLEVSEGTDGEAIKPGHIYIAPGNAHMRVKRFEFSYKLEMNREPLCNGHRPSVDVLFDSVLSECGGAAIAVLMTGMGADGAKGLGYLYNAGARTVAQSEASCVVYGMPRVAVECGYAEFTEPLNGIVPRCYQLLEGSEGGK